MHAAPFFWWLSRQKITASNPPPYTQTTVLPYDDDHDGAHIAAEFFAEKQPILGVSVEGVTMREGSGGKRYAKTNPLYPLARWCLSSLYRPPLAPMILKIHYSFDDSPAQEPAFI